MEEGPNRSPTSLDKESRQAKLLGSLGRLNFAHTCGCSSSGRGAGIPNLNGGRNSVVGGRSCAARRDLTGFDLDKGSTSPGKAKLALGRVLVLV